MTVEDLVERIRGIEAAQAGKMVNFRRHDKNDDLYLLWFTEPLREI